jgi:hypothetical protein
VTIAPNSDETVHDQLRPTTGWFVYGITWTDTRIPRDLTGIGGEPVVVLPAGGVAAVVTQVEIERPLGRGADLLAYNSVLDALAQRSGPVVPVRFGSVLDDDDAVRAQLLLPEEQRFDEILGSLAGREQFLFSAEYDEQQLLTEVVRDEPAIAELRHRTKDLPPDAAYSDRVRLGELVSSAVAQRRDLDADRLLDDVLPLCVSYVVRPVSGLEPVTDVALLVDATTREQLEHRLEVMAEEEHPRIRLRLMGPVAPYDFSDGV